MNGFKNSTKMVMGHNFAPAATISVKSHSRMAPMAKTVVSTAGKMPKASMTKPAPMASAMVQSVMDTDGDGFKKGGKIDAAQRKALPKSEFGMPGSRKYPVDTRARAVNAKARATQMVAKGKLSESSKNQIDSKANAVLAKAKGGMVKHHDEPMIKRKSVC